LFKNLLKKVKSTAKKATGAFKKAVSTVKKKTTNIVKQAVSKAKTTKKATTSTVQKKTQPLVTKLAQSKPIQYIAKDPARAQFVDDLLTFTAMLPGAGVVTAPFSTALKTASKQLLKAGVSQAIKTSTKELAKRGAKELVETGVKEATKAGAKQTGKEVLEQTIKKLKIKPPKVEKAVKLKASAPKPEPAPIRPQTVKPQQTPVRQPAVTPAARTAAGGTTQAGRAVIIPQSTALVPVSQQTRALVPGVQQATGGAARTAAAGAGAGVGAGAVAGTTQAARAAAAGLRSLGARVAGAGAGVAQRLGAGAAKVGSGLRTAGQFARRNWGKAAALGLAGGLAYGMFAPGNAMEEEVPATMEPETPDQQITGPGDSYITGGYRGGGIGSMTDYGVGGMSEGAGMPGLQEMKDELFSLIDSSVGQNSVMTVSWMNQLLDSINQMEQQLMEQYRQQGSELDPATKAALDELRRDVELRRQTLMEELNRRGLLQSGIWLEEENRLNQGLLTSQERLLASRLSDIQNRITEAMQNFAQQRMNIMGSAWQNEMANVQWGQQARLDALQNLYQQQLDQSRWAAEYGLDVAKFGLQREKAARSGTGGRSDSVTRQFIQAIPEYGSLQEALQAFNQYRGEMAAKGADINAILQNIYTYFGSGGY